MLTPTRPGLEHRAGRFRFRRVIGTDTSANCPLSREQTAAHRLVARRTGRAIVFGAQLDRRA